MIKKIVTTCFGLVLGLCVFGVGLVAIAILVTYPKLPSLDSLQHYQPKMPLIIYSADGEDCGIAAAVTVDETEQVNYPYLYAKGWNGVVDSRKHCSFCCSLLTPKLLAAFDFQQLDDTKNWFDVTISHESLAAKLHNYLFCHLTVLHRPHGSRPWKQLKYKNPLKYYWIKWTKGFDKI